MAAPVRASGPVTAPASPAIGRSAQEERLPIEGALPAGLDGCLLRTFPHPAGAGRAGGGLVFSGIRLGAGAARRHRATAAARGDTPLGPVPALAPSLRFADSAAYGAAAYGAADSGGEGTPAPRAPGHLSGHVTLARPIRDPATGWWHTVAGHPGLGQAEHLVACPGGTVVRARPFALGGAPLMHAVALTERYVVVFDLPVVYRHAVALVGARLPYTWQPGRPARVGLLPRHGTAEPRWFRIGPCHISRAVNAYDEGDRVVLDAVWHPRAFDATPTPAPPHLRRLTFDLADGAVRERPLSAAHQTALVDERVCGRRHRHVFGSHDRPRGAVLVRHDLVAGRTHTYELGGGRRVDPPVFVPRPARGVPGGQRDTEGDGWILALAHDDAHRRAELLVFDALDLAAGPSAAVRLPGGSPAAHRATWLPAEEVSSPARSGPPHAGAVAYRAGPGAETVPGRTPSG